MTKDELVRCRDCRWWEAEDRADETGDRPCKHEGGPHAGWREYLRDAYTAFDFGCIHGKRKP